MIKPAEKRFGHGGGFTLIEFVIAIALIGIMSAVVLINLNTRNQHSVTTQADEFRRALSHMQLLAISQGARLKLTVTSTNYSVCAAATVTCNAASAILDPTMDNPASAGRFSVALTDGASFTLGTGDYYFDSLGRPVAAAAGTTLKPGTTTFKLNGVGRATDVTVTVLPITGFAQTA